MKTKKYLFSTEFNSDDILTLELKKRGVNSVSQLLEFVQHLPYGRNENRENLALVLSEMKGTCSSKHAFIKEIANRNNLKEVYLILGIYKMNDKNTPKIGSLLKDKNLDYIPEAHCYLKIENDYVDVTSPTAKLKQ